MEPKFTGQIRDSETGMDFFTARYYGSAVERFISPDPANAGADATDPQSWNAYAYVRNNPLALVDPLGLCTFDAQGNAVEDENGACYEGGFGGSVTVVAQAPEEIPLIWVSFPSGSAADQGQQVTPSPQLTESLLGAVKPPKTKTADERLYCAARYGDNHSIAAAFGAQNTFIGQFLGGNTVSGLADIYLNIKGYSAPGAGDLAQVALGGAGQGIPPLHGESGIQTLFNQGAQIGSHSAGWDGAAGIAVDHIVEAGTAAAARILPAAAVGRVASLGLKATNVAAWGQFILDSTTFAVGLYKCW